MTGGPRGRVLRSAATAVAVLGCLAVLAGCAGSSLAAAVALPTTTPQAGTSGTPARPASGSGAPSAAGAGDLPTPQAAADLVYANRYDAADAAYLRILAADPGNIDALTGYALFLNYRLEYDAAKRQVAAAVAVAPHDARVLAVQCRVDDWSGDLVGAVAAGQEAIRRDPGYDLGHVFLSEALADHGDVSGARNEVASAKGLITVRSPVYDQAELQREIGNLARDAGDTKGELAAFLEAARLQPTWVERPSELASAYLDNSDLPGAHTALQQALALAPDDAALLQSLGSISMLEGDYDSADGAFTKLGDLRPDDATALTLAAHAHMAHSGDIDGSVSLLERALSAAPGDAEAAGYLLALERYVRGDAARGQAELAAAVRSHHDDLAPGRTGLAPTPPDVDAIEADHQRRALAVVNNARSKAGLPPVTLDAGLNASAVQHCYYWLFNNASDTVRNLGIHRETYGLPGFTGAGAGDRANAHGWHSGPVTEDITHRGSPEAGVNDWINSVYHRFPILRSDLSAIGYGDCGVGSLPMEDMEFGLGNQGGDHHAPTPFPADGQSSVPAEFVDNEIPDPVPAGRPRTTGYPVTVNFDPRERVTVSTFTLVDDAGHPLDGYRLDPGNATENCASLLPVLPLTAGKRYTAHIAGTRGQDAYDLTWSFTVAG